MNWGLNTTLFTGLFFLMWKFTPQEFTDLMCKSEIRNAILERNIYSRQENKMAYMASELHIVHLSDYIQMNFVFLRYMYITYRFQN